MRKRFYFLGGIALLLSVAFFFWISGRPPSFTGSCPFCDPAVLARQMIHQGEKASLIVTYRPAVDGHVLVIPNRHVPSFSGLTSEEMVEMGQLIQKVQKVFAKSYRSPDSILLEKNGRSAGQSVPHVHFHVMPRNEQSGLYAFWLRFALSLYKKPLKEEALQDYVAKWQQDFAEIE